MNTRKSIQISHQTPKTFDKSGFEELLDDFMSLNSLTKKQQRRLNKKKRKAEKLAKGEL